MLGVVVGLLAAAAPAQPSVNAPLPATLKKLCFLPYLDGPVVRFHSSDGVSLVGAIVGKGATGIVVGNVSNGSICDWVENANATIKALVATGAQVLLLDNRGSYPSAGTPSSGTTDLDLLGGAALLRAHGAKRIVFMGGSLGGVAALFAASKLRPAPAAVIGLSASGFGAKETQLVAGGPYATAFIGRLRVPMLFVMAKLDPDGGPPTRLFYKAASKRYAQLLVIPGSTHAYFDADSAGAAVRARLVAFLRAHVH